jgi:hypothetical protein
MGELRHPEQMINCTPAIQKLVQKKRRKEGLIGDTALPISLDWTIVKNDSEDSMNTVKVWKVMSHDYKSCSVGNLEGIGKVYPPNEWVERDPDLGPLLAFDSEERAQAFVLEAQAGWRRDGINLIFREAEAVLSEDKPERRTLILDVEEIYKFWREHKHNINEAAWPPGAVFCQKIKVL